MKWQFTILSFLITTSSFGSVKAYFNQNTRSSYRDPYRNISRNGDNLEAVLLKEIGQARKTIYMAVQELRLPLVAEALIERYKAGVDVRIILENNYNFTVLDQRDRRSNNEHDASKSQELRAFVDVNRDGRFSKEELETRDAIYMIRNAKIPVMDDTYDSSRGSGLMHHKFVIIDGKSTIVSTANFTMSCIHGDFNMSSSRGNANSMIHVESTNFAKIFTEEMAQLWGNGKRGNFGHNKTYRGSRSTSVSGTKITVQFSPTSQRYNWEESTNGLIAAYISRATSSIKAALFVFSDQNLADVMQARSERGARVGVIIEPKFAFREYSELLDLLGLEFLNSKCAYEPYNNPWKKPVREVGMARLPSGDVLHHKFAVIDNKTVIVGSQNWSDAANYINDEFAIVIQNSQIAQQFSQEYERIKRSAVMGAPSWLKNDIRQQEEACADSGRY